MLAAGDIAFIGINTAGGPDDWVAFVTLAPIAAGTTIYFTDNELPAATATAFNTGESYSKWTATADVAAGTVITLTNFDIAGGPVANVGAASVVAFSGSSNRGFSQTADSLHAYTAASDASADTPLLHLARINLGNAQDGAVPASLPANLAASFVSGQEGAVYSGPHSGQASFADYVAQIADPANWTLTAGATPVSALDASAFTTAAPVPVVIFTEAFASFVGGGLAPVPTAGQLDSDVYVMTGMSDGSTSAGGTFTTGDFARGATNGGVTTGGLYALNRAGGDHAVWFQPAGSDFNPGTFTVRVINTDNATRTFSLSYDLLVLNDQGRASSFNVQVSADNASWTNLSALDFTSPLAADSLGVQSIARLASFTLGSEVANGGALYIRFTSADAGGSGSRDEFGIDNIVVSTGVVTAPLPTLSIDSPGVAEGDAGTSVLTFTVSLSAASAETVTVNYATADNTATIAGNDYVAASGTLAFLPGETVKTVAVTVNADTAVEANETLRLNLADAVHATIATAQGTGTIQNDDFALVAIHDIQGAGLVSPLAGQVVTTTGVVTAVDTNGFYLQAPDAQADADVMTSEAVFVFTSTAPTVQVGDGLRVTGTVTEFVPGGASSRNLSTTELVSPTIARLSTGNALPGATLIGEGGRLAPTEAVGEGIAFFESLEAMRVTIANPMVVTGTNEFGELWVVSDNGAEATNLSPRNTLVSEGSFGDGLLVTNAGAGSDYNPERIQIDADSFTPGGIPIVNPGALLSAITGVVSYNFGNFEVLPTSAVTVNTPSPLLTETTALVANATTLTIAQYNVLNLDPNDADGDTDVADGRFELIARQIVNNLQAPDIIALQEIQDNSGSANDGTVSASVTLQMLADAIAAEGGPTYSWIDNPFVVNNQVGGEPGGNIRVAYLYNAAHVDLVSGSVATTPDAATDFAGSRVPLVATFAFGGQEFTLINNHFSSKGGSSPLAGSTQPAINGSAADRLVQAQNVADYVESLGSDAQVIVLGDLNEFTNEESLVPLYGAGMTAMSLSLDPLERYSYMFEGNAQELDQTFVSLNLLDQARIDIVHANAEFAHADTRASDHDPSVLAITLAETNSATIGDITVYDAAQSLEGRVPTPVATDDVVMVRLGSIKGASAGAESVAYENGKVYATNVNGDTVNVHAVTAEGTLVNEAPIALTGLPGYGHGAVNSVAVKNGVIAVAYQNAVAGQPGHVALFSAADHALIKTIEVGIQPDSVTFSPDGSKLLVANEGEAISLASNPFGSVSVIDMSGGAAAAEVGNSISFASLNGSEGALAYQGLVLYPGQLAAADIEPEYITVSPDGTRAYVTLQEVNAVAVIDLTDPTADRPIAIQPLGTVDRSLAGNAFDASDKDGIDIATAPVLGLLQPDAIASFTVAGATYFVTANEGDARVGAGIEDTDIARLKTVALDPAAFPNAAAMQADAALGRLNILTRLGDTDGDGDYDKIYALGGRSISIFRQEADGSITKVRETGGEFEAIIAANHPALFNSNQSLAASSADSRSDDKGPEPEGVTIGQVGDRLYAFVGLERVGGFMVYDVTDPENAVFVTYRPETAQDLGPEVQTFVSAASSPTGQALLLSGNEISNTVTLFSVQVQNDEANLLTGGAEADSFHAKGGDDTVTGNGGNDAIDGGLGTDTAVYAGAWTGYDVTDGGATVRDIDPANGDEGTDTLVAVERLSFAGVVVSAAAAVNDAPIGANDGNPGTPLAEDGNGAASGNVLANDTDADLALGLGETLTLTGARAGTEAAGGDLAAVSAPLVIDGTYGLLTIAGDGSWSYALDQSRSATQALNSGQFGAEVFTYRVVDAHGLADTAQLTLTVTGQSELVTGGNGKETLTGGVHGDLIEGFNGTDTLFGLAGDDTLDGGNGADSLTGGLGRDVLIGGNGPDRFVFETTADSLVGQNRDVIADFETADTIVLSAIDANALVAGNQAFAFIGTAAFGGQAGELRAYVEAGSTIVAGDVNGDGLADFEIGIAGLPTIVSNNFIL